MGFRFRKSINIGKHFRLNISSKGIGYSYGVKGMRHTVSADGKHKTTYSIPGTGISYTDTQSANTTRKNPSPKSSRGPLKAVIFTTLIVLCFSLAWEMFLNFNQGEIPPPPEVPAETDPVPEIYFTDSGTLFLSISGTAEINLELHNTTLTPDDFIVCNDNAVAVSVTYGDDNGENIMYSISALSPGVANIFVESSDGTIKSDTVQVIVDAPETMKVYYNTDYDNDNSYSSEYILNTSTKKAHKPNCSYAPSSYSGNYKKSSYVPYDYERCDHCH